MSRIAAALAGQIAEVTLSGMHRLGVSYVTRSLPSGAKLRVRTNDRLARYFLVDGQFEQAVRNVIRRVVGPGMTVLDIGANLGYHTVEMSRLVGPEGTVVAFEPQARMVEEIHANVRINALRNVRVVPVALSDSVATRSFYVPVVGDEAMGSLGDTHRTSVASVVSVNCTTLDEAIRALGITTVDFIKMDVEGAELQVVKGGGSVFAGSTQPQVVFEAYEANCAPFGYRVFDLLQRFSAMGYDLTQLDGWDWHAAPKTWHSVSPHR
jgi:FkbM family methyltransferase